MFTLHLDIETFCELPLAKCGAHRYAERAEVMLVQHAWGDGPVDVWETAERPTWAEDLQYLIDEAEEVVIHNSAFERSVLAKHGVIIPVEKIDDTMVVALQHGLPGSLGMLCDILGVPRDLAKDKDGKKLIHLFCQPRPKNVKLRRATKETHPDEWTRFLEYARLDVDAMRDVRRRTPRWNCTESERHFWRLDQRINDRGFAVDMALARGALRAFDRASRTLATRAAEITGGVVTSTTQRDKLIEYLASIGCKTFDLTKDTVSDMLTRYTDERVVELLQIRQQASATSPAKYKALLGAACEDDRLRGSIQFCGASRTGRDAGRIFQPQNLPRPSMGAAAIEVAIDAMKADCEDLLYNNVSEVCVNAVRGSLVAEPGTKLVVADLSNIEGRVLAWLAGEAWKIKAFSEYDRGIGHDLYVLAYARAFNLEPQVVVDNKKIGDGRMRQIGKVMELACLGPNTLVLTDSGVKVITDVSVSDRLWDGGEWVTHRGLVHRGRKPLMDLAGLQVTEEHQVLCGETWLSARMVGSSQSTLDLALATGAESLLSLVSTLGGAAASTPCRFSAPAGGRPTAYTYPTGAGELVPDATYARRKRAASGVKSGTGTPECVLIRSTGGDYATAYQPAIADAITQRIRPTLTTGVEGSQSTSRGDQIAQAFLATSSDYKAGMTRTSKSTELTSTKATSRETYASSDGEPIATMCDVCAASKPASTSWSDVYDIADAGPRNRFTVVTGEGSLVVHNCGYQGGLGAFTTMGGTTAKELGDDAINDIVRAWRRAHSNIQSFWYDLEGAAKQAIRNPGEGFVVRDLVLDLKTDEWGVDWLRMRLPSGRYLCYMRAHLDEHKCGACDGKGNVVVGGTMEDPSEPRRVVCPACAGAGTWGTGAIRYEGVNQYTRQWTTLDTYGGKLTENAVQAIARDVLFAGMQAAEEAGYAVVLRVHDELVTEVPDTPEWSDKDLSGLMATNPPWATGLPLAAAGFEGYRYRKD